MALAQYRGTHVTLTYGEHAFMATRLDSAPTWQLARVTKAEMETITLTTVRNPRTGGILFSHLSEVEEAAEVTISAMIAEQAANRDARRVPEHADDMGNWCPWSLTEASDGYDDGQCPAGCRDSRTDDTPDQP